MFMSYSSVFVIMFWGEVIINGQGLKVRREEEPIRFARLCVFAPLRGIGIVHAKAQSLFPFPKLARCCASPSLERPVKGAALREAEQVGNFTNGHSRAVADSAKPGLSAFHQAT